MPKHLAFYAAPLFAAATFVHAEAVVASCQSLRFPTASPGLIKAWAEAAIGRVFPTKDTKNHTGTAIVIDASEGIAISAKHVVGDGPRIGEVVYIDFPAHSPERLAAKVFFQLDPMDESEEGVEHQPRDIVFLKFEPQSLPRGDIEISPQIIDDREVHSYLGYPGNARSVLDDANIPSRQGDCTYNFDAITIRGESGGAAIDGEGRLVGIVIQNKAFESQGIFVPVSCFATQLADQLTDAIEPAARASERVVQALKGYPPNSSPPSFRPPPPRRGELWVSNLDLMRFIEEVSRGLADVSSISDYMECPILQAAFDRLHSWYWAERAFKAMRGIKEEDYSRYESLREDAPINYIINRGDFIAMDAELRAEYAAAVYNAFENSESHMDRDEQAEVLGYILANRAIAEADFARLTMEVAETSPLQAQRSENRSALARIEFRLAQITGTRELIRTRGLSAVAAAVPSPEAGVIYFEFDRSDLTPEARAALDDIISDIRNRELGGIVVAGHTDDVGSPDYNMQLAQRRANSVAAELIRAGIPAQIITTEAYGETDLAVPTPDSTPEQANRRVVIEFHRPAPWHRRRAGSRTRGAPA